MRRNSFELQIYVEAGDRFQLIERAAGVAKAATADHRDVEAGRGDDGSDDERGLVADAAGGVFVHLRGGQVGPIEHLAGIEHGFGEGGELGASHAAPEDGHQKGG